MTSSMRRLAHGAIAGAAGTTALNAATNLDMALRARPASSTPQQLVSAIAKQLGTRVPGSRQERGNRLAGLGALSGAASGIAVGAAGGALRAGGIRLPAVIDGSLLGAAAMAASDVPMALLGVSDPRKWSAASWAADAIPHLAYGLTTHAALVSGEKPTEETSRGRPGWTARAMGIGAATGGRSSAGIAAVSLCTDPGKTEGIVAKLAHPAGKAITGLLLASELVLDKTPQLPPRLGAMSLGIRLANGGLAAGMLARRNVDPVALSAVLGTASAAGGAFLGRRWRGVAPRWGGSAVPDALLEDAVVLGFAGATTRSGTGMERDGERRSRAHQRRNIWTLSAGRVPTGT